jgi:hypothetical protein
LRVSLFVGAEDEDLARARLVALASSTLKPLIFVSRRLPHSELMRTFSEGGSRMVFVCSSVYETMCITALEAALSGLTTLVPNNEARIGVLDYIPASSRFIGTEEGLFQRLLTLSQLSDFSNLGVAAQEYARTRTGVRRFALVLERVLYGFATPSIGTVNLPPQIREEADVFHESMDRDP